jgi:hypothetical protein
MILIVAVSVACGTRKSSAGGCCRAHAGKLHREVGVAMHSATPMPPRDLESLLAQLEQELGRDAAG